MTTPAGDPANPGTPPANPANVTDPNNPQTPNPVAPDPAQTADPVAPVTLDGTSEGTTETPDAEQDGTAFIYHETGDPALDVALDFIGRLGIGPEDPAIVAATEGKFELLEAKLAVLGDKATGWERHVALAKDAYQRSTEAATARTNEIATAVNNVASAANVSWADVQKWASANADPAEKQAINAMLTADKIQARMAAQALVSAYTQAAGTTVEPRPAVNNTAAGGNPTDTSALSPRQFAEAVNALARTSGSDAVNSNSPEYQALVARRLAYRG